MGTRYIVRRALTGAFLTFDLPLRTDGPSWDLTGAGSLTGTLAPDVGGLRAPDGALILQEWGSRVYQEVDGLIRWGGIVIRSEWSGQEWSVEAAEDTTYPHGLPYDSVYTGVKVDPAQIIRDLWGYVQGKPDGDLGVSVSGSTGLSIGSESTSKRIAAEAAYAAAKKAYDAAVAQKKTLSATKTAKYTALTAAKKTKNAATIAAAQATYNTAKAAYEAKVAETKTLKTASDKAKDAQDKAKDAESADGGAYLLQWWESPDVGDEIQALCEEYSIDYTLHHVWNADKTDITTELRLHYPRAGRRRADLTFEEGVNIIDKVVPVADGDSYANEVLGLGAGEGKDALKSTTAIRDGRLRRVVVVDAKDITKKTRLDKAVADQLTVSRGLVTISQITVRDHPGAPIGSWSLGDDITVKARVPWLGDVAILHRITSWQRTSETTATLTLARSDSFTYGS